MNIIKVLGCIAIALFLLIVLVGFDEPDPTSAKERAAIFSAQEEYYRVLNLYGDEVCAEQSARLTYERMMED